MECKAQLFFFYNGNVSPNISGTCRGAIACIIFKTQKYVHRATTTKKNQETYQQRLDDWENKTGIFSDDTIVAQKDNKKTLTMNNFTINKDQLALNAGENPTLKPIIDKV